jgi:TRAP-type transport system periplasmic protein
MGLPGLCFTKRAVYAANSLLVLTAALFAVEPAVAQNKPEVNLTAAGYAPPTHVFHRSLDEFLKNIQKASDGKIGFAFHPTGSLIPQGQMLQAGRTGTAEIVSISTSTYPGEFRFSSDAGTLLFLWNVDNFDKALKVLKPQVEPELAAQNLKLLYAVGTVTQFFLRKPTDLDNPSWSGRKIRGFGGASNRLIEILGGTNITIANNELAMAASTGVLDGLTTGLGSFASWGIDKELPCMVVTNDVPLISFVAINRDAWDKIPAPLQKIMSEEADKAEAKYIKILRDEEAPIQKKHRASSNCVQDFTAAQREAWQKKLAPLYAEFRKKHGAKGEKFLSDLTQALK